MAKRHIERLTVKEIEKLGGTPGRYPDGNGLYLSIVSSTSRSWILRYEIASPTAKNGRRERWMGLGSAETFTLKEARVRAKAKRQMLADGIDPLVAKKTAKAAKALEDAKAVTFEEAAQSFFDQHQAKWRSDKHRDQFISSLRKFAFPKIGRLAVGDVDTGQVLRVLEQKHEDYPDQMLWDAIHVTADRVRNRIEQILDWATVRELRKGNNPAKWTGHLAEVLPERTGKVQHMPSLPYAKINEFMTALATKKGSVAAALEFTVLTAARSGETLGMEWDEWNEDERTWLVPAGRIKGEIEHRVPLSDRAMKILQDCKHESNNGFVFIGPRRNGLSDEVMSQLLKRMGYGKFSVHGFRSSFRSWAGDKTNVQREVIEKAMAHLVGDETERAYDRGTLFEKRRDLMAAWATYCGTPIGAIGGNVVDMRGAA